MKVEKLMTRDVAVCTPESPMSEAARLLWERDCGVVPVVDPESGTLAGVITDRDLCMASFTRGAPLSALSVRDAMAREVRTCTVGSDSKLAHAAMREAQVRRLPVVDAHGRLEGMLSLSDLVARTAGKPASPAAREVFKTLVAVCRRRGAETAPPAKRRTARKTARPAAKASRPTGKAARKGSPAARKGSPAARKAKKKKRRGKR